MHHSQGDDDSADMGVGARAAVYGGTGMGQNEAGQGSCMGRDGVPAATDAQVLWQVGLAS